MSRETNFCPKCGTRVEPRERFGTVRPVCPQCDHTVFYDPKVAVVVLVIEADRVLLVKRGIDPGMGKWALPAGFVDAGEDPKAAAAREVLEETGLVVDNVRLLDVFHSPQGQDGLADIVIGYAADVQGGVLEADDDAEEAVFFGADDLPELVFHTTNILIGRWLETGQRA